MRKKITMLLASLFVCMGAMKADVTDLPQMSTDGDIKWYTISNTRSTSGKYLYWTESGVKDSNERTAASLFYLTGAADACYIHNYSTDLLFSGNGAWTEAGVACKLSVSSHNTGLIIAFNNTYLNEQNYDNGYTTYWDVNDLGSIFVFEEVTDFSSVIDIAALKTAAKAELDNLAKIAVLFPDATQAKADVDAVNATSNSLADLNAAAEEIQAVVAAYKKQADGKNVRFTSYGRNTTNGTDLTAVVGGANQTSLSGDAGIWTLKFNEDGTFKMYNFVSNLYLGATAGNGSRVSTCSTFADAAPYTFNAISENRTNIQNNANTLHADGWGNVVQWNPDNTTSESSIWTVVSCDPIVLTREQYDNAAAAASSLPYAIQQAYGLVTDAAKYTSNAPETDPNEGSSYANLLDNAYTSYFHSTWSGSAEDYHYLQAEVSEEVKNFSFYFKKRNGNNNNRPTEIEVLGSNDGSEFTPITTITEGLPTSDGTIDYFSAPITAESNVKYIRFVVKKTNTDAKDAGELYPFFTFSEFYILPATDDVTSLIDSYNAFASSSITETAMADAATALINAETTLALSNIKKEVNALLTANTSNHAVVPALGQYTTEAYNALNAAYTATDATQESLEAAIAAFEVAQNTPVYVISGVYDYANGKAIYYNGSNPEWRWDTKNVYNKAMWFRIFGLTSSEFATNTDYNVVDFDGRNICNHASVKIQSIEGWEDAYNLQYGTGSQNYIHAANHSNNTVTYWYAATTSGNQASAWQIEYIGNSYDLAKLTDEQLTALSTLNTAYASTQNVALGTEVGLYTDATGNLATAQTGAAAILGKTLTALIETSAADVTAANTALTDAVAGLSLNVPEKGKFYRLKNVASGNYMSGNASDITLLADGASAASTIFYLGENNELLSYNSGLYLDCSSKAYAAVGTAHAGEFAVAYGGATANVLLYKNNNYWTFGAGADGAGLDRGSGTPNQKGYNWTIEEVTTLPVAVSAAGYATLYAPVALTIPAEGVTVYTATVKDGYLALTEVEGGAIPANTGVIIEAAVGTYNFAVAAEEAAAVESDIVGAYAKSSVKNADAKVYTLQKPAENEVGFYLFKGQDTEGATTYINGFRAWVEVPNGGAAPAMFSLGRGEGTTSIDNVQLTNDNVVIYDLSGRRVEKMEKGIYIVNGKKVVK